MPLSRRSYGPIISAIVLAGALLSAHTSAHAAVRPSLIRPLASTGCGQTWTPGSSVSGTLVSGGVQRTYLLHIPKGYTPTTPLPLILNLPGANMNGVLEVRLTHMSTTADADNFIVVYPNALGTPTAWVTSSTADVTFLNALVSTLEGQLCIDTTRIGVTGMSSGAVMAYHLACSTMPWLASIAPVAGTLPGNMYTCHLAHPTPLLAFNGEMDTVVPYGGVGLAPPIPQVIASWAGAVGCPTSGQTAFSQGDVVETVFGPCGTGADTALYSVTDGGHQWPGGTPLAGLGYTTNVIDASALIYNFVAAHPLH